MKIPQTTKEEPYIEFLFDIYGNLTLSTTSHWWGGSKINLISIKDGVESKGNSCKPKDLKKYIIAYKRERIKEVKEEIAILQEKLKQLKSIPENWKLDTDLVEDSNTVTLS